LQRLHGDYQSVEMKMGVWRATGCVRLFPVPGMQNCWLAPERILAAL
jgi:hypothetical protein